MRAIKVTAIIIALCFACACRAAAQVHDRYENACASLRDASPPDLLQFLRGVTPDEKNGWCVTWAIHKLGNEHYEPAVAALVKLLDFRRPLTREEKMGFYLHAPIIEEMFPAAEALESTGKNALPDVLSAIEAGSTSSTARENAVSVWMEAYKYDRPKGVFLLKEEETKADNDTIKQKLKWAVQIALKRCSAAPEEAACVQAAADRTPRVEHP